MSDLPGALLLALCLAAGAEGAAGSAGASQDAGWQAASGKLYAQGRFVEALERVETHLLESPRDAQARLLHGILEMRLKRYGAAAGDIEKALEEGARNGRSEALIFLGQARAHLGRYEAARVAFTRALEASPGQARMRGRAMVGMGYSWLRERDLEHAEPWLRRAAALDPPAQRALLWLGDLLLRRGRLARDEGLARAAVEEAVEVLEQACSREPASEEAAFKLSLAYRVAGLDEPARAARERFGALREENRRIAGWEAGLKGRPEDRAVLERLAGLYESRHQRPEALRALRRLHALFPSRAEYALRIKRLGRDAGRVGEEGGASQGATRGASEESAGPQRRPGSRERQGW